MFSHFPARVWCYFPKYVAFLLENYKFWGFMWVGSPKKRSSDLFGPTRGTKLRQTQYMFFTRPCISKIDHMSRKSCKSSTKNEWFLRHISYQNDVLCIVVFSAFGMLVFFSLCSSCSLLLSPLRAFFRPLLENVSKPVENHGFRAVPWFLLVTFFGIWALPRSSVELACSTI